MRNASLIVALFDLDGTLCNARHLAASIIGYQFKHPTRIPRVIIYLITQAARLLFLKIGLLTYARVVQASSRPFARLLKGLGTSEAFGLFSKAAQTVVGTTREEMLILLKWHQEQGHTVIVVSGGFQPFLSRR